MKVFRGFSYDVPRGPCALTIGNFDGVHRGHMVLLAQLREAADRLHLPAAVLTFSRIQDSISRSSLTNQ